MKQREYWGTLHSIHGNTDFMLPENETDVSLEISMGALEEDTLNFCGILKESGQRGESLVERRLQLISSGSLHVG